MVYPPYIYNEGGGVMKWQISMTWLVPHYVNEYGVDDDVMLLILSYRSYLFAVPSILYKRYYFTLISGGANRMPWFQPISPFVEVKYGLK